MSGCGRSSISEVFLKYVRQYESLCENKLNILTDAEIGVQQLCNLIRK